MIIKSSKRLKHVKPYYFATKMAEIAEMNAKGLDVLNIGIGSPDLQPHDNVIKKLIIEASKNDNHGYQSYKGIAELRTAFSEWFEKHFNVDINSQDELQVLSGAKEGIMHIAMSFINEGDKVLVPDPGYPSYTSASLIAGAKIIKYNLKQSTGWLPDFEELEKQDLSKVKIMWLNYPHMPTGAKASKELFQKAVDFAIRNNILLVNDNPYNFILNDSPMSIFEIESAKKVALELVSLSKTYNMAGWRIGAVVGAKEYIDEILKFKSNMDSGMFKPVQLAGVEALNLNENWIKKVNDIYKKRRVKVWEIMDMLNCSYDKSNIGMFAWGKTDLFCENEEKMIEEILQKAKVFITPGRIFGENGKGYIRISLTNSIEKLEKAIARIKSTIL